MNHRLHLLCFCCLAAVLAGCNSGVGSPSGTGGLDQGLQQSKAEFLVLDLASGAVTYRASIDDLLTNPAYRQSRMVFRRTASGTVTVGAAAGSRWDQGDEPQSTATVPSRFLAVFEVTRAQWQLLGGGDPASAITPAGLGATTTDAPVSGLSKIAVTGVIAGWTRAGSLSLPDRYLWEYACRAGSTGLYAWGDSTDPALTSRYANVSQTAAAAGPQPVGTRQPNAWGFYDMHGNAWEWTSEGELRGGSWNDGLPMARSSNRLVIDPYTPHALAGLRLVYAP